MAGIPLQLQPSFGFSFNYLVSATRFDAGTERSARDDLNKFDIGAVFDAKVLLTRWPKVTPALGLRFEHGLIDIADGGSIKNRAFLLTLSVSYRVRASADQRDSDGDGISDADDKCPDEPEDQNDYLDSDGCPDAIEDTDGDGVELISGGDECPQVPEDKDGFEDSDGCPDPDNDQDGLLDADDVCPDQAFPHNKDLAGAERRGCPPEFERVAVDRERIALTPLLVFENGSSELSDDNEATLDEVAALLNDYYPDMRLRLVGHTDPSGNARYNRKLSRARADAVRTYLVGRSVADNRLSTDAIGEDDPSYFDDKNNRRVDLVIARPADAD